MAIELLNDHPDQPRSWTQTVDDYLLENGIPYFKAIPLAGGHSAYVWRIEGYSRGIRKDSGAEPSALRPEACVLKYAEAVPKGAPQFTVDANRMRFEAQALRSGPAARASEVEPSVQVPRVLETTDRALLMSWGGETDLRSAYIDRKLFNVGKIGSRLGRWLAAFHNAGLENPEASGFVNDLSDTFVATEHEVVRKAMLVEGFTEERADAVIARLGTPAGLKTLISWDSRPMNTLLRFCDANVKNGEPDLTIVDWECAKFGCPVDDLRLWIAEALVLEAKYGQSKDMVQSFMRAYRDQASKAIVTEDFVYKLAVSVGSILMMLVPSGLWTSEQSEIDFWKARAMQFVRAGVERDFEWLAGSDFAPLLWSCMREYVAGRDVTGDLSAIGAQ